MLYATSKTIIEHIKEQQPYSKIVKVISINILYFDLGEGDDYIYKGTTSFIGLHNHSLLKLSEKQAELYHCKDIEAIYPEYYLIRINNFDNIAKDTLDQWIYFLKNEEIQDNFKAKGLSKAKEVLDYLKYDEAEKQEYQAYKEALHYEASMYESNYMLGKMEGMKEGIKEGIKEGMKEGVLITAKNMKQLGIEFNIISQVTGLSIQQLTDL
ncbi:hypothetical protein DOJK_00600 [Patescibacteria group bacterium]|nr:hypothetical protein DOJK_00600 [Patescibacteria group bacterium]